MDTPLTERDARLLSRQIVERLRALGGLPSRFGVNLNAQGFSFTAWVNQRMVTVQTGQGNFSYDAIARELLIRSLQPVEWGSQFYKIEEPGSLPKFVTH